MSIFVKYEAFPLRFQSNNFLQVILVVRGDPTFSAIFSKQFQSCQTDTVACTLQMSSRLKLSDIIIRFQHN